MTEAETENGNPALEEAARELQAATHDAQVAIDASPGRHRGVWDMLTPGEHERARLGRLLTPEDRANRKPGGRP